MSFVAALLAPLAILLPLPAAVAPTGVVQEQAMREDGGAAAGNSGYALPTDGVLPELDSAEASIFQQLSLIHI